MTNRSRAVLASTMLGIICGCHQQPSIQSPEDASTAPKSITTYRLVLVENVQTEKDPKGGWFSPRIRNVYFEHDDSPQIFCGSGPSIPTGKRITIFASHKDSTPESIACTEVVKVIEGDGRWYKGRAFTNKELEAYLDNEEHLMPETNALANNHMLRAWMKATPIGEPCTDVVHNYSYGYGLSNDIALRNKGKNCSIIIVNRQYQTLYTFINWKIIGNISENRPIENDPLHFAITNDVVNNMVSTYGSKYLISDTQNK